MQDVVIVESVRTPIGRYGGVLKSVRPDDLAALVISEVVKRSGVNSAEVEDVIFGDVNQAGEDNRNVARMASLIAGLPIEVAGVTINRLCASGLQSIVFAGQSIQTGNGDVMIAGGVESMSRAPFVMLKPEAAFPRGDLGLQDSTLGWRFVNPKMTEKYPPISLGETAENVAERCGISRQDQDAFAFASQQKTAAALREGRFKEEIVPVQVPQPKGAVTIVDTDEHPRPDTTLEQLAALKPAFKKGGTVTAGNSSGINDGAAALVLMSLSKARELGHKQLFRIVASAVAGVDPAYMGLGPISATKKALSRADLSIRDIGLVELNEAFASQSVACVRELDLDPAIVNVNGGAIALGHPLGCTGARLVTTLVHEMKRRKVRYGLATMCIGVGQGAALIVEQMD
jgi:3-oxoadipyl-CoA thiolase